MNKKLLTLGISTAISFGTILSLKAEAVPVYVYVRDNNSTTPIQDRARNTVNMPIRVINSHNIPTQPTYRGSRPWCQLQGSSLKTDCSPSAIYRQLNAGSRAFSHCFKYFGSLKPIECQTPEDRQLMNDLQGAFKQPGQ
ncbi:MAG: hypothetical protein F6K62_20295 [Sphaerospermopsis sp. SIO1G2]|nr:hypothetical protein [Sphaerospermopsis sp. SIO1G2]